MYLRLRSGWIVLALAFAGPSISLAQQPRPAIPHAQDKPPNDPRDPQTAARMMTVPEGFVVDVVAAEPDIVNPVAMAIDERGRFWITESLEYPRREPGPGSDRVKILEDTDGDGKADKFTVFMEGLNIPSGIAVGHGGVWIANSPDILFVQDTDGDGKADRQEVVVTGFGRTDTHELPNSLTWGPDGWLYGLNGVFNFSHVKYAKTNPNYQEDHKGWPLTCAMFRIHPRTREFQVYCEGTSNPWGIAFNNEGEAFISACVIDHLWHLVETGYYHRQGGPYPPFTWKIDSIVRHKHQKAAYCGIHFFDSDAYPEPYRGKLYMGNIHGGCINVDRIERDGATYRGFGEPDFLTANDAWFMPVVQKTGPDGCLYILDWYDRYHCYQDANRDPAGIDRLKGRLYRVRYTKNPIAKSAAPQPNANAPAESPAHIAPRINLAQESDEQLIARLAENNDFVRWTATRILSERRTPRAIEQLKTQVFDTGRQESLRLRALWALAGMDAADAAVCTALISNPQNSVAIRAWAIRLAGNLGTIEQFLSQALSDVMTGKDEIDRHPEVRLQLAIAQSKIVRNGSAADEVARIPALLKILADAPEDPLIPRIVWQNLHPLLEKHANLLVDELGKPDRLGSKSVTALVPRIVDRILGRQEFDPRPVARLFALLHDSQPQAGRQLLEAISSKVQSGELKGDKLDRLKREMASHLKSVFEGPTDSPLYLNAAFLATAFGDQAGFAAARRAVETASLSEDQRLAALGALVAAGQTEVLTSVEQIFNQSPAASIDFRGRLLSGLARLDDPGVATLVLRFYPKMEPELQPKAIELLTQRAAWARQLLTAIGSKAIPATVINLNQARRLKELKDEALTSALATHWGQVREGRDPHREQFIASMKALIRKTPGDELAGEKAFKKVCAQCHKIYGEGAEVGPDITRNGRNDFTQLLSNVFDPSLVIGAGYRSYTVVTKSGRVVNGLLAEDSPLRVVLKVQGGKLEVIPRDDIDELNVSEISLMPEQLEKQLTQQEIIDLFAFITLDKHPGDPSARRLPGVVQVAPRESLTPAEFPSLVNEILPGFQTTESGELGIGLLAEHLGRDNVLRTHPVSRDKPCVLTTKLTPPADRKTSLIVDVSHDPRGDWRLVVRGNGERLADEMISKQTCQNGWRTITVDLTKFAGREVKVDLVNQANDWSWEFAYWGGARFVSE